MRRLQTRPPWPSSRLQPRSLRRTRLLRGKDGVLVHNNQGYNAQVVQR